MELYHSSINNKNPDRKKTAIESKIYPRFITTIALSAILLVLTLIATAPISPVQATGGGGGGNETAVTPAPGGASLGPAANETNVTAAQSACLPQNATTTGRPAVDAGAATTTTDNTTATVAPSGASIGGNETSASLATAGNTTTDNTTATVAPSGASIC
jgi:hypothetical protein